MRSKPRTRILLVVAVAAALTPAASSGPPCPPPGGGSLPALQDTGSDFTLAGRGWGHGVGMSQWGAQGAAKLGCSVEDILGVYYPGAALEPMAIGDPIRVGLAESAQSVTITAQSGGLAWEECTNGGCAEVGAPGQAQGSAWTVAIDPQSKAWVVSQGGDEVARTGDGFSVLRARLDGTIALLDVTGVRYRHGVIELQGGVGDGTAMTVVADIPSFDAYLYGLAEMPSSWEPAALQAQAVAGRTYALSRHLAYGGNRAGCRCDVYASTRDQAYKGYEKEGGPSGDRWVAAVDATAGRVLRHNGRPIESFYNSSNGGQSETPSFVFGGADQPYLGRVDDSRWEQDSGNPNLAWAVGFSADELGAKVGVGRATSVEVAAPTGAGGRVGDPARGMGGLVVRGTSGSVTLSGNTARAKLGLRSALFRSSLSTAPVERVRGGDRIGTAVAASRRGWPASSEALLAAATSFADALSAAALAARLDAPLLLTAGSMLPDAVGEELTRLGVRRVTILGGPGVVSPVVEQQVRARGHDVRRLHGPDRFATAAAVAAVAGVGRDGMATITSGTAWPDAVAAGALAALDEPAPALLVLQDSVPAATKDALQQIGVRQVTIVGGASSIGEPVVAELRALGIGVRRLSGPTRWATSAKVAEDVMVRDHGLVDVVAASGMTSADALTAGAVAARLDRILFLVPRDDLDGAREVDGLIRAQSGRLRGGLVLGGTAAVGDRVLSQLSQRL